MLLNLWVKGWGEDGTQRCWLCGGGRLKVEPTTAIEDSISFLKRREYQITMHRRYHENYRRYRRTCGYH